MNKFFIIRDSIQLMPDMTIVVGKNSVLCFEGGCFIGGRVDLNGALIQAPEYCIFDGTIVAKEDGAPCSIGNDEVLARWFQQIGADNDIAPVVNHALDIAPQYCVVALAGNNYTVKTPIVLNKPYQTFRCPGTLKLAADVPAISLRCSNLKVNVRNIVRDADDTDLNSCGILYADTGLYSEVKVERISGTRYGIAFIPDHETTNVGSISYAKIRFNHISSLYGIYLDMGKGYETAVANGTATLPTYETCVSEINIQGGLIDSKYGIYCRDRSAFFQGPFDCAIDGNVFSNITFGDHTEYPVTLWKVSHSYLPYLRLHKQAREKQHPWISLDICRHVEIGLLHELPYDKVAVGDTVYQTVITAPITGTGIGPERHFDRMYVYCDGKWYGGPPTKYLSSSMQSYNMVNTLNYPDASSSTTTDVTLADMLVEPYPLIENPWSETRDDINQPVLISSPLILSDLCVVNIGTNRHIVLDLTQDANYINAPVTIIANMTGLSGSFSYKTDNSGVKHILDAGTFRVTWDKDGTPQIIKIE